MKLDGKEVTSEQLAIKIEEASNNVNVRIVEKADGEWVTLGRLNG